MAQTPFDEDRASDGTPQAEESGGARQVSHDPASDETLPSAEAPRADTVSMAPTPGGDRVSADEPPVPKVIGRYRVLRKIGQGGMGTVYEAEQFSPKRTVALKVIRPGLTNRSLLRRFEQETQVLGRLQHVGIAQIYEAGTADAGYGPQPYFAMELVRGGSLRDHISRHNLGTRARLELMAKICDAVHYAHQRGVIHRDLKPGNILVDSTGQPKILDFGVARATDADVQATTMQTDVGQLIGTLAYMSPEQVAANPFDLDIRSDVYALGVITYEMLAGGLPYDLANKMIPEAARIIREDDPTRLSVVNRVFRGDVETIVAKTLEKDKGRRYGSAAELGDDIRRYLGDEPIVARPPSTVYQLQKFAKRNKPIVVGVCGIFVALVAGIIVSTIMYKNAEAARRSAVAARDDAQRERDRALAAERRAEDNFSLARNAVDRYLNGVAESPELKAHGLESLRRKLLSTAREFYEQFIKQRANDKELHGELITAYQNLANISRQVGESDAAEEALRKALTLTREKGAKDENIGDQQVRLSNLQYTLGLTLADTGRFKEAEAAYTRALEIENAIGQHDPDDQDHLIRQANTLNSLGILYANHLIDAKRSEQVYRRAIGLLETLVERFPSADGYANTLVLAYSNLATLFATTDRPADAEPFLEKAIDRAQVLAKNFPGVPDYVNALAASYGNLAGVQVLLGQLDRAQGTYEQSLKLREELAQDHPAVVEYRLLLGSTYTNLGELNCRADRAEKALPWFAKAVELLNGVLEQEPRQPVARYYLSYTYGWRARSLEKLKRMQEAVKDWDRAIEYDDRNNAELRTSRDKAASRTK